MMPDAVELRTERLRLRGWREEDRAPYAALNADPEVMALMPSLLTREQSDAHVEHMVRHHAQHGFGLWAVEVPGVAPFVGFVGLSVPSFDAAFTPCVEVGWRLARPWWGRGYATEGAVAALRFGFGFGFGEISLDEVVSFTSTANVRSQQVMARIGLSHDPADDFDHPSLPAGHRLLRHVLYRARREPWLATKP
ncbi:GNAT family N-acetyltransferase [soil metagenome]